MYARAAMQCILKPRGHVGMMQT